MKQFFLFLFFSIFLFGYTYSQIDIVQDEVKSDTIARDAQEDISSSFSSVGEGYSDDEGSTSFVPSLLHSSQDVYQNLTSYNFSIAYFRNRGYDNQYQDISINGFMMNSLVTGRASFSQWGGLNNVVRWPERIIDMNSAGFTFGNIGGATNYDLRASGYRKRVQASYAISNRSYMNRIMATAASGVMKGGWSVVGSASARFGDISWAQGTSYTGFSAFFGAEKKFNEEHALNLTAFASPTQRGMQANSTQEIYDLVNSNYYNPNWGWYQGKKRNARVRTTIEPAIFLTHYYTPKSNKFTITSTIATTFGRNSTTSLNWNDVPDPRPDYYKNSPSYYVGDTVPPYNSYDYWTDAWKSNANKRQIDWDTMYFVNQLAKSQGLRAQYMVENRVIDHFELGGASYLMMNINNNIKLSAGVDIRGLKQHNYKTINDMLGGLFWLDVDKFSEGDFSDSLYVPYNDLNNMDVKLTEGDVFGYDYNFLIYNQKAWAMFDFAYPKIDFHLGGQLGATEMWRVGFMRNGRFPTKDPKQGSEGKSVVKSFFEGGAKAGITYKVNGRNYLVLNGEFLSSAPSVLNSFLAPRIRNTYIDNLKTEKVASVDLSYVTKYPFLKMRASLYFTQFFDVSKVISFYAEDLGTMANYAMTGINKRHLGAELGAEIKLCSVLWLVMAGNFGDYRYSNNPSVYANAENGYDAADIEKIVYWKNYFVAGSPQVAATLGLKFNYKYWWVNINANYFDRIFCDLSPVRRTQDLLAFYDKTDPEQNAKYHQIADQTRLKGQFTLDVSVSKSWRIKRYTVGFNVSATNITNNKKLVTSGWEQYRFDYKELNTEKFQNKYYYAFGTTFYAGFNFTFN